MKSKYSYLTKNVLLFSISGFIPKILAFILVPIYTSYLSAGEYGVSDLITTTVSLFIPIFTLDIQDAVMRFSLDKDYKKQDVFSVAIRIILAGTLLIASGAFVVSRFNIITNSYLIFFVIMYFTTATNNTITLFCRGIDKVGTMVIGGILNSVITLAANILFLVVFHWGLTGYLVANTIGAAAALIWCFFGAKLYRYIRWNIPKTVFKDMVVFSFPLIFSVIAWWVNTASDRYILSWLSGVAVSGIYAISYKIPSLLSMFQNIFFQAWSISAIKEFDKDDSDGFIGNMYTMMNFAMVVVCSGLMIMNIPIAKILYANEFFEAWKFVPPLLISVVFNAMALFIGSIFTAVRDTKTLSISTIIGAIVNTACNFLFIYCWGAYGAALATLLGYGVVFLMRHIILRKHIRMKIKWRRDIITYIFLVTQMIFAVFAMRFIWVQIIICLGILLLYYKEIKALVQLIRNKLFKKKEL